MTAARAYACFVVSIVLALVWPGPLWLSGLSADTLVLGLPAALSWSVGWVALSFCALLAWHLFGRRQA